MASASFLMLELLLLVTLMTMAASGSNAVPTSNFIDTVSGYNQLSTCAEEALSTIVRAQFSGCGDDGQLTSYTCFCTDSSSVISSVISTAVMTSCGSPSASAQASSALSVFDGYCALGVEAGLNVTSTPTSGPTSTAMPAPSGTTTGVAQTASPSPASSDSDPPNNSQRTTAIAAGIVVPVVVVGLALALFFFYRKRARSKHQHAQAHPSATNPLASSSEMGSPIDKASKKDYPTSSPQGMYTPASELPAGYHERGVHELSGGEVGYEADPETWKRG